MSKVLIAPAVRGSQKTRAQIIEAAKRVFLRGGYFSSLDEIAIEADVGRRTVYNQFDSKEELFRAVVRSLSEELIAPLVERPAALDLRSTLEKFAQEYLDILLAPEYLQIYRLIVSELYKFDDLALLIYSTGTDKAHRRLADIYRAAIRNNILREFDADLAAERFLSAIVGTSRFRALLGLGVDSPAKRAKAIRAAVDEFLRGNRVNRARRRQRSDD